MADPELVTVEPDTTDKGLIPLPHIEDDMAKALEEIANLSERGAPLYARDRKVLRQIADYLRTDARLRDGWPS